MNSVSSRATSAALLLLLLAGRAAAEEPPAPPAAPAPAAPAPAEEPPAATVRGKPLPRRAVHEELARRMLRGEEGDRHLERLLLDECARREMERRGIAVGDAEVREFLDETRRRVAERLARTGRRVPEGKDPLSVVLEETGATVEEFAAQSRFFLGLQRMAREDLGATSEVPDAQVQVWLRDLLRKKGATTAPKDLRPGEAARLAGEPVTWEQAGRWLSRNVRKSELLGVVYDLAFGLWIEDRAAREGIVLGPADLDAEVARLRVAFRREPGVEGTEITLEEWLRDRQGLTVEELRASASFRAGLLARRIAGAEIPPERVRKEWEDHRERWGESARVRRIVVHGEERASAFGSSARPMKEALALAERALDEIRGGRSFEAVARKYSEDHPPDGPRGQPVVLVPAGTVTAPQPVLDAVFAAKEGELLGPIRAFDGYHLVRVERRVPAPAFEECAPRVREDLVAAAVRDWKLRLRSDPDVKVE